MPAWAPSLVNVHYPPSAGRIVLRAEPDWQRDIEPASRSDDGATLQFDLSSDLPFRYYKPVHLGDRERWAIGPNRLWIRGREAAMDCYPCFEPDSRCAECELLQLADETGRRHRFRIFYPPGYHENTLRRYPVLYMQDGQNLFFPEEAYAGRHWRIAETLHRLDAMNALEQAIVVGVYPNDREADYTLPGYEAYGRFLVCTLKPYVDARYRTRTGPRHTAVMGASLGGVVSLYLAWQYPEVFGAAACLSSTFGWRDDLRARIAQERIRPIRVYLDSGWPQDNYEATRHMRSLLASRGWRQGIDLHYYAFPEARHDEHHWAMRVHLPFQLFFAPEAAPCTSIS